MQALSPTASTTDPTCNGRSSDSSQEPDITQQLRLDLLLIKALHNYVIIIFGYLHTPNYGDSELWCASFCSLTAAQSCALQDLGLKRLRYNLVISHSRSSLKVGFGNIPT